MTDPRRREIGARLRTARILANFSQAYAANELHVAQQTIGSWESGRSMPPLECVYDICMLYGVSPRYVTLAQTTPNSARFDFCPKDGRSICRALSGSGVAYGPVIQGRARRTTNDEGETPAF